LNFTCSFGGATYNKAVDVILKLIHLGIIRLFQLFCHFGVRDLVCTGIYGEVLSFPVSFTLLFFLFVLRVVVEKLFASRVVREYGKLFSGKWNLTLEFQVLSKVHHECASRNCS
jgi:hypothetical protein